MTFTGNRRTRASGMSSVADAPFRCDGYSYLIRIDPRTSRSHAFVQRRHWTSGTDICDLYRCVRIMNTTSVEDSNAETYISKCIVARRSVSVPFIGHHFRARHCHSSRTDCGEPISAPACRRFSNSVFLRRLGFTFNSYSVQNKTEKLTSFPRRRILHKLFHVLTASSVIGYVYKLKICIIVIKITVHCYNQAKFCKNLVI